MLVMLMTSCSIKLSEQPPKTVTSPQYLSLYEQARNGDIGALKKIGNCYEYGLNGFPKSARKAMDCYENAALAGDVYSARRVGYAYLNGEGRFEDDSDARKFLQMAAVQGDATAAKGIDLLEAKIRKREAEAAQRRYNKQMREAQQANMIFNALMYL